MNAALRRSTAEKLLKTESNRAFFCQFHIFTLGIKNPTLSVEKVRIIIVGPQGLASLRSAVSRSIATSNRPRNRPQPEFLTDCSLIKRVANATLFH